MDLHEIRATNGSIITTRAVILLSEPCGVIEWDPKWQRVKTTRVFRDWLAGEEFQVKIHFELEYIAIDFPDVVSAMAFKLVWA